MNLRRDESPFKNKLYYIQSSFQNVRNFHVLKDVVDGLKKSMSIKKKFLTFLSIVHQV